MAAGVHSFYMEPTSGIRPLLGQHPGAEDFRDYVPAATGAYPVRPGNLVRPIVDGVPAFQRIADAIEAALDSVWLTVAF